jgi:hypothetical protein
MTNLKSLAVLVCFAAATAPSTAKEPVAYPEGFRKWSHVHSAIVGPGGGRPGMYHIYANEAAMRGYATGHFPNGAAIAFDLFDYKVENNVTTQTTRKLVDVMVKDSTLAEAGGWRFEEFVGEGRVRKDGPVQAQCAQCHATQRDHDYVFSRYRE